MIKKPKKVSFIPSLDARSYHCVEHFRAEMSAVFHKNWIYTLHESQLPEIGSYETFEIAGKPLLIVRSADNVIRTFYNVCVHRGHLLAKGPGKSTSFTCPYHAWTYSSNGKLRGAPGIPNVDDLPACHRNLVEIETNLEHGFVFVRLNPGGASIEELYGDFFEQLRRKLSMFDRLRFAKRFTAEVDGNWKIMIENYLECYHCTPTHPALADLMSIKDYRAVQSEYLLSTVAPAGRPDNAAYRYRLDDRSSREFSGWWLWPNATFNIFPGQQNLLIFHMLPVAAEKTIGYCDYFFIDGQVDDEAQALMDWEGNILEAEDNNLIVAAQKGMRSEALKSGIFVVDEGRDYISEGPLAHFNMLISRALANAAA
jgi:choline monooxygenase